MKSSVLTLLLIGFSLVTLSQEKWNIIFVSTTNNAPISGLVAFSVELKKEFISNKNGIIIRRVTKNNGNDKNHDNHNDNSENNNRKNNKKNNKNNS